jgi:hypothetical protein
MSQRPLHAVLVGLQMLLARPPVRLVNARR